MSESRPAERRARGTLETLLGSERALVLAGVLILCGLAWVYLAGQARDMSEMADMSYRGGLEGAWTLRHLGYLVVMWAVMMVAMMLPSAAPTILLFARVDRSRRTSVRRWLGPSSTGFFVLGYLLVWSAYSVAAAGSQWVLHQTVLISPMMVSVSPVLSGGLLIVAGAFQFSRLKDLCARHCRSPLHFLTSHWRAGRRGGLEMGTRHGAYCVGCCWALMALLFVLGVMNLLWVTALALFVLVEKTVPGGKHVSRMAGAGLIAWGAWLLLDAGRGIVPN